MLFTQQQENSILMTYLEDYKIQGPLAQPYFILTFFEELLAKKGLCLIRGDILDYKLVK